MIKLFIKCWLFEKFVCSSVFKGFPLFYFLLQSGESEDYSFIKLPFQLLPSSNNEIQIILSVRDITLFQTLRGTLTYIMVVSTE